MSGTRHPQPLNGMTEHLQASNSKKSAWIVRPRPRPEARLKLFCAPHAGGGPHTYHTWPQRLPDWVEVCSLLPPGRDNRFLEQAIESMEELVRAALPALAPELDRPFAFFGHSMGGTISFALSLEIQRRGLGSPVALFVSGSNGPQFPEEDPLYLMPQERFVQKMRDLNSVAAEVWENRELMELMLPVLRADCKLLETYVYRGPCELTCPIVAFDGVDDPLTFDDQVAGWAEQTSGPFTLHKLQGDHFFLDSSRDELLEIVANRLSELEAQTAQS